MMDDNIIQNIIDSEKLAQAVVDVARDERRLHDSKMQAEINAYSEKARLETDAGIERFASSQSALADAGVAAIEREAGMRIAAMREAAEAHMDEWVDELYGRILGGGIG